MKQTFGLILGLLLLASVSFAATPTPRPTSTPGPVNVESSASTLDWFTATGSVVKGRLVGFTGAQASWDGQPVRGVSTRTLSTGGRGPVIVAGPAQVQAGSVTFRVGDGVSANSSGLAKLYVTGDFLIGYATEAHASSSAQPLKIIVAPGGAWPATATYTQTSTSTNTPTATNTRTPTPTPTATVTP